MRHACRFGGCERDFPLLCAMRTYDSVSEAKCHMFVHVPAPYLLEPNKIRVYIQNAPAIMIADRDVYAAAYRSTFTYFRIER